MSEHEVDEFEDDNNDTNEEFDVRIWHCGTVHVYLTTAFARFKRLFW
jgi:hypothetical protein